MYTTDDNDTLTNRFHFHCVDCNGDTIAFNFKAIKATNTPANLWSITISFSVAKV